METDKEKLKELCEKVEALHKGYIEAMRRGPDETASDQSQETLEERMQRDIDLPYRREKPQNDDLLPVDTALMEKCILAATRVVLGEGYTDEVNETQAAGIFQTAQSLFIGTLLDSLVGAVGDLQNTTDVGLYELNKKLEGKHE